MTLCQTSENLRTKNNFKFKLELCPILLRRVLIIDDDLDMAAAIKLSLEFYGNSICEIVSDPYEALLALSDQSYDFVFIDQKMPGLNGASILTMLDKYVANDPLIVESGRFLGPTPVVLMSGSSVKLENNYKLTNFNLVKIIEKKDLPVFLALNFAS